MNYLQKPHLPDKVVGTVVLAEDSPENIMVALNNIGLNIILSPANPNISNKTATHADMNLLHLGDNKFVCAKYAFERYKKHLINAAIISAEKDIHSPYPYDALLNVSIIDKFIFINKKSAIEHAFEKEEIQVKQGYSKCNIVPVADNAIITEDPGIYLAANKHMIDVLLIQSGCVTLDGFPHGFIGGACGKLAPDLLAITGNLNYFKEKESILDFCRNHGVYVEELSVGRPCDIGSILPISYK